MNLSKSAGVVLVASLVVLLMCVGIHAQNPGEWAALDGGPDNRHAGRPAAFVVASPRTFIPTPGTGSPCRTSRTDTRRGCLPGSSSPMSASGIPTS